MSHDEYMAYQHEYGRWKPNPNMTDINSAYDFGQAVSKNKLPWYYTGNAWDDTMREQYMSLLASDIANEHEYNMWRVNNEYNTPVNQMKRMIEAGINPAAAYGQVTSGTSGSAPGTHMSNTPHYRSTTDRLAEINTILNGIEGMFSAVGGVIQGVEGVQDIQLGYQNNWQALARRNAYNSGDTLFGSEQVMKALYPKEVPFEVAPGVFTTRQNAILFPEVVNALSKTTAVKEYNLHENMNAAQTRIDGLVQSTMEAIKSGDWSTVFDNALELILYRFSGGRGRRLNLNFLNKK